VIDDGSVPGLRGSVAFDDEGVLTRKTVIIREGVLVGRLHNRETAAELGEQPTGNGRATSYHHPPLVRMTKHCHRAGAAGSGGGLADLIRDVEWASMPVTGWVARRRLTISLSSLNTLG